MMVKENCLRQASKDISQIWCNILSNAIKGRYGVFAEHIVVNRLDNILKLKNKSSAEENKITYNRQILIKLG